MVKFIAIFGALMGVVWVADGQGHTNAPGRGARPALRTIILDAGHGGVDPGASGMVSHEATIALGIVLKLGKAISKEFPGTRVIYTRTSDVLAGGGRDVNQSIRYRAELANRERGDLFLSVHCNATGVKAGGYYAKKVTGYKRRVTYVREGGKRVRKTVNMPIYHSYWVKNMTHGTATYIWAADRSGSKGGVINDEGQDVEEVARDSTNLLDLSSPEAKIRAQLYEKKYFANSFMLASMVEEEFRKTGRKSYGVAQRNNKGIWVLQATAMPSILIETGFVTNQEEERYLTSKTGQNEIVKNVVAALKKYKVKMED